MEYRYIGKSGLKVSSIGLGTNNFGIVIDEKQTNAVMKTALDQGINFFDTADIYGMDGSSEILLGKALKKIRDRVVIATKFGSFMGKDPEKTGASRRYIIEAAEASLKRLGTDYIDLYQIHDPDPNTPIEETMRALDDLVRAGKVRYIGCSNFSGWQLVEAQWIAKSMGLECFISAQDRYSILTREIERELIPAASEYGVGILPYFPLESGLLTGKYRGVKSPKKGTRWHAIRTYSDTESSFWNKEKFELVDKLQAIADENDHSLLELVFGWLLANSNVPSVIAGATKASQVKSNVKAGQYKPSENEMAVIHELTKPFVPN